MKLPPLHERLLADALQAGAPYGLVLAGGYAVQAHELVSRLSQDLDFATTDPAGLDVITTHLAQELTARGWQVAVIEVAPRMSRMTATDPVTGQACELDLLLEVFTSPPAQTSVGPVLSLDDTIGLKTRAVHDRGFPRDLIDVFSARHLYGTLQMELLGAQHEDDFDLEELHARLEAAEFTHDREFTAYGMALDQVAELRRWVKDWADDLGVRLAARYDEETG
ncbi:nucleotidyl transferase AbiEii/AbiGii toxin family protein [Streptomyces sp. NPDC005408]|uniref:nucleotidyl transferase AbiEii/AbiGii toxin family protein n=1 Tax=Streptomyces sp. NPDC005408 TaxID=3155341 RepID=UPI0033AD24F7